RVSTRASLFLRPPISSIRAPAVGATRFVSLFVMRLSGLLLLTAFVELRGQQAHLAVSPVRPLPGALVRLSVTDAAAAPDSLVAVTGTMAGEPLHFRVMRGAWRAIGAVPVDSGGDVV